MEWLETSGLRPPTSSSYVWCCVCTWYTADRLHVLNLVSYTCGYVWIFMECCCSSYGQGILCFIPLLIPMSKILMHPWCKSRWYFKTCRTFMGMSVSLTPCQNINLTQLSRLGWDMSKEKSDLFVWTLTLFSALLQIWNSLSYLIIQRNKSLNIEHYSLHCMNIWERFLFCM